MHQSYQKSQALNNINNNNNNNPTDFNNTVNLTTSNNNNNNNTNNTTNPSLSPTKSDGVDSNVISVSNTTSTYTPFISSFPATPKPNRN